MKSMREWQDFFGLLGQSLPLQTRGMMLLALLVGLNTLIKEAITIWS